MENWFEMSETRIKRYSMAQIKEMIAAGQYYPVPDDAPFFDENEQPVSQTGRTVVELDLTSSTVERFKKSGPDYLKRMADVLEGEAKKAS